MSGNSGAWGLAMWKDGRPFPQQEHGISLEGGDAVVPYLPTEPLGCLIEPPEGMGVPPVRSGDVAFAQRDGVVQFGDYYEPRILTFRVEVTNDACPGCSTTEQVDGALVLTGQEPGHAFAPDSAALDVTGNIDIRVFAALDDWTPSSTQILISKYDTDTDQRSYQLVIQPGGIPRINWSEDGVSFLAEIATEPISAPDGSPLWVRVTMDVNDGGGTVKTIRFYTSSDGVTWTQLGSTIQTAGVTSIFAGTAPLEIGSREGGTVERLIGDVFYAEVRNGIDGTVVANPDFDQPPGTTSFVDSLGNTWTVVSPATLVPFSPAVLSARQKVARLTEEWSRNCSGATLVIFSDCHDPDATEEEKVYLGPYLVHGRPRVADVTWRRSDIGGASVLLRFDAEDARLQLADTSGDVWSSTNTEFVAASDNRVNLFENPSFEVDVAGLLFSSSMNAPSQSSFVNGVLSGSGCATWEVGPTPSDFTYLFQVVDVAAGEWLAARIPMRPSAANARFRARYEWRDVSDVIIGFTDYGAYTPIVNSAYVTVEAPTAQAPAGTTHARVYVYVHDPADDTPAAGMSGHTDAWIAAAAPTEAEANAAVDPYFDGDSVGAQWTGTAHASTSIMGNPASVEVVGSLCAYPIFTLDGALTAPIEVTYGSDEEGYHSFTYNDDLTGGDRVVVDTKYGRATSGSLDATSNLLGDYNSPLAPGVNQIILTSADPADTGSVTVEWQNSVVSG